MISPHGRDLLIWMVVFTIINLSVLALRFFTISKVKKRGLRADDFLIVLSVAAMLAMEGTTFWAIHHGLGARTATLSWPDIVVTIKLLVSAFWTWTIATCACKVAILYLYLELFYTHTVFKMCAWVLMGLCVAYVPTFITVFMTQCSPVNAAWDPVLSLTNCRPRETHELVSVAINVFLDVLVVAIPLPVIWNLQMPMKKKVAVTGMFSLGSLVIGIMIWRLVSTALPKKNPDLVYDAYLLALQSHLELWLGILAANLPTLAPLIKLIPAAKWNSYLDKFRSSSSKSTSGVQNIGLRTFGAGSDRRTEQDEFTLLEDDSSGNGGRAHLGGISRHQEFEVQVTQGDNNQRREIATAV